MRNEDILTIPGLLREFRDRKIEAIDVAQKEIQCLNLKCEELFLWKMDNEERSQERSKDLME